MSRILKRPMFKMGGSTSAGITSGLSRQGYHAGERVTGADKLAEWGPAPRSSNVYDFLTEWGLNMASSPPMGNIFSTAAGTAKEPYSRFMKGKSEADKLNYAMKIQASQAAQAENMAANKMAFEESKLAYQKERDAEDRSYEKTRDVADRELQKYLGEIEAKGKTQWIVEELDKYWDAKISAVPPEARANLQAQKADERREVLRGYDVSDTMAILRNTAAFEKAEELARGELQATINPATTQPWKRKDKGFADEIIKLTKRYLRQIADFLKEEKKIELDATGGRVGRSLGGGMTEDVNVMTKTPGGISDINVSETVERDPGETKEINISYDQLRDRLPPEISNEIVLLLSQSYEAFADFAEIQTQADVNEFNTKYNVQLFLPQQTGV
jgi:hypothetical protein